MKVLAAVLMMIGTSSIPAYASSAVYQESYARIAASAELQETLAQMGYDSIEAGAEAFDAAAKQASASALDLNAGTLAVCGQFSIGALMTFGKAACATLFNSYEYEMENTGAALFAGAGISAIYFRSAMPENGTYCYQGASIGVAGEVGASVKALAESSCLDLPRVKKFGGFFVGIDGHLGLGLDLSWSKVKVRHIKKFTYRLNPI